MINAYSVTSIFHGRKENPASRLDTNVLYDPGYLSCVSFQDCATGSLKECLEMLCTDYQVRRLSEQPHTPETNVHTNSSIFPPDGETRVTILLY